MVEESGNRGVEGLPKKSWFERLGGDMENLPVDTDAPWEMIPIDPEWTKGQALFDELMARLFGIPRRLGVSRDEDHI